MRLTRTGFISALLIVLLSMVTLVVLEVVARVVDYGSAHWRRDTRIEADGYAGATWTEQYYDELAASAVVDWHPYVYWRLHPYSGTFVRVNEQGIRHTWKAPGEPGPRVFVLGGSTVWGTGARDEHTMPSYLARHLANQQQAAEVVNLGETGYVTRQDVEMLVNRLKAGDIPDVAVFYGAVNNIFSALQNGVAGLPQNEANRRREFQASDPGKPLKALRLVAAGTQSVADGIRRRLERVAAARGREPQVDAALVRDVVTDYCADLRTMRALSAEYGFRALFFWQPVIFTKSVLTAYEQGERDQYEYARPFFDEAYAAIRNSPEPCPGMQVHNLSDLFANERGPVYLDAFHLSEAGNETVARALLPAVTEALHLRAASSTP